MNGTYICIKSISLGILTKGFENKGESVFEGTSIVFVDRNKIKKKNGSRIYSINTIINKIENSKGNLSLNDFFIEEKRFKYKGLDSELLNLKRNKDYLYGGNILNGVDKTYANRIFLKRFPEAVFLELTKEEFIIYFNNEKLSLKNYNKYKEDALHYINLQIRYLTENLGSRINLDAFFSIHDFVNSRKLKEFQERKSLLISTPYDKLK